MSARRILLGSASLVLDKVVVTLVQLAMVPVLAHAWGLELYGTWAMIGTIPAFLAMGDFGIVTSAWARMTMFLSNGEFARARTVIHTAWSVLIGVCAVIAMILAAVLWSLPDGVLPKTAQLPAEDARLTILCLMVYGLGTIVFRLNTAIFRASGNFPLAIWCNTLSYGIENAAVIIAAVAGLGVVKAAMALLAMRVASIGLVLVLSLVRFARVAPGIAAASRDEWREMWRPAFAASVFGIALMTFLQASVAVLGAVAGPASVPIFVAVRTLSRIGLQATLVVAQPASQEFGAQMARGDQGRAGRYFALVLATSAGLGIVMAAVLILAGKPLVRLWTGGLLDPSIALLVFLGLSSLAGGVWNPMLNLVLAVNRQKEITGPNVIMGAIGLAFIWATGRQLGAPSAAIASALVDSVTVAAILLFAWRNWLSHDDFAQGVREGFADMRRPIRTLRALRRAR